MISEERNDFSNEKILVNGLKEGKKDAYGFLVEKYSQVLYTFSMTKTKDAAMAEDIVQNVFFKLWKKRHKINITSSLKNYLFKAAQNEFIKMYNKRQSRMVLERKYLEAVDKLILEYDESSISKVMEKINREISKLPPKCREVFLLSRKDGLTNFEISEYLEISPKTVEGHITKAFTTLRNNLSERVNYFFLTFYG